MGTVQEHSTRAHAILSASGAGRWLNCTPSARLEEKFGVKKGSEFAAEGTLAHELAELYLRHDFVGDLSEVVFDGRLDEIMSDKRYSDEMPDMVGIYADYCGDSLKEAKANNGWADIFVETKLDLTEYVPESFGTADCIIVSDGILEIVDLKYGKGVPVYADYNKQLMLYALGALRIYDKLYDISAVRMTIVQPRLNNISSFMLDVTELVDWAETELKERARMAFAGEGELQTGEWCKFCSVKNRCTALRDDCFETAKEEFTDKSLMTDTEIEEVLTKAPFLIDWLSSVQEYAKEQALNGKVWQGFKLVEGRSIRKYADEDKVVETLFSKIPTLSEEDIFDTKLKSLTTLEKAIGKKKFEEVLGDLIVKPQGKPTLVGISDKRPAIDLSAVANEFENLD